MFRMAKLWKMLEMIEMFSLHVVGSVVGDQKNVLLVLPSFQSDPIFSENLVAVELKKSRGVFVKPIYIGMAKLDILKVSLSCFSITISC